MTQEFLRLLNGGLNVRVSAAAGSRRVEEERRKVRQESKPGRSECCEGVRDKMPPDTTFEDGFPLPAHTKGPADIAAKESHGMR